MDFGHNLFLLASEVFEHGLQPFRLSVHRCLDSINSGLDEAPILLPLHVHQEDLPMIVLRAFQYLIRQPLRESYYAVAGGSDRGRDVVPLVILDERMYFFELVHYFCG